jgi:SAM-dependent methyltransferase/uncharacterized membrane protein YbhN (UPF0104 family)
VADAGQVWAQARSFHWWLAVPAVALTLSNVLLRLLRWQFLLRRAGVWLPMRQSAGIFVAGLAMLLTPAYAGEGVKTWLVARAGGLAPSPPADPGQPGLPRQPGLPGLPRQIPTRPTWPRAAGVVVSERLLDALALALVAGGALHLAGEPGVGLALTGAGLFGVALGALVLATRGRGWGRVGGGERALEPAGQAGVALTLSLLAWLCGCLTLYAVCRGLQLEVSAAQAVGAYGVATLLGGLTFLPAGVGVVGTAMLVRLEGYGATLQEAVLAALLVRLLTVWLTAALGVAGCWRLWHLDRRRVHGRRLAPGAGAPAGAGPAAAPGHFDALGAAYAGELSPAARERVVGRKVALTLRALRAAGVEPGARLLDAGCGPGWYVAALARAGYRVVGVDLAPGQIAAAREAAGAGPGLLAASVLALPFRNGAFDAALAVNVLHHAGDRADHDAALAEMARAVRPGGLVLVHEISTVNPLYRLYMAYLFPLWKRIDLGTEVWLDPRRPPTAGGAALDALHHYTFLPDFTPGGLYRYLAPLERWLERSRWAPYGAHFTAVYRRRPAPPAGAPQTLAPQLRAPQGAFS